MKISNELINKIRATSIIDFGSYHPAVTDIGLNALVAALNKDDFLVKKIMLNENFLNDAGIEALSNLKNVELLCVSMNQLTDSGAKSIAQMKSLVALDIAENEITDDGMSEIVNNLPSLKSLTLTSEAVGDKTVEAILNHLKLEEVLIYDDENVESDVLDKINKHTEKNKEQNKSNQNNASEPVPSKIHNDTANTAFFKIAGKLEDKENIADMQQALAKLIKEAMHVMKKMPNPDEQEEFKKSLAETIILQLSVLPNSPVCKG